MAASFGNVGPGPDFYPGRGLLIAFEGIDGAGKTSQLQRLAAAMAARGLPPPATLREPTDGPHGRRIRGLAKSGGAASDPGFLELFLLDRAEDVEKNIGPALAAGRVVLIDRYILSNAAYQGALAPPGGPGAILAANSAFPWPSLTLLLEIDPVQALKRVAARGGLEPAFENPAFLAAVKAVYDSLEPPGLVRIDGRGEPDQVFGSVLAAAGPLLGL
jgi:dTMP kinase